MGSVLKAEMATCLTLSASRHNESFPPGSCNADFDRSLCWAHSLPGNVNSRLCPFNYCTQVPGCEQIAESAKVTRFCGLDGHWADTNYDQCIGVVQEHRECVVGFCRSCPDFMREMVIAVSLTLSILSVILLVATIILFSIFDSIQCRRLSIHKNLATAFVFRFAVLAVWTITNTSSVFQDCTMFQPKPLMELEWICKTMLWFVIYTQVASVMWMLIEGVYLYSRFTVFAMRHSDAPYWVYLLCGWGAPFVVVNIWTYVHNEYSKENASSFCWLPYATGPHLWILAGTMGFVIILNMLFLLGIVIILVQKLRSENSAESKKIWRTIKATLLLVPLLGVSNVPLFYEPAVKTDTYMLASAILQHSQGIFIAVLYCFLNSEIQNAVRRQLAKVPLTSYFFNRRNRFETERTYVPPESRGGNHKLGLPMEEMNGVPKSPSKDAVTPLSNGSAIRLETIHERDSQMSG